MPASSTTEPRPSGGIHVGDVGGSVSFSALGDIVAGNKVSTFTTIIQISVEAVTQRPLNSTSPYRGLDRFEDRDKDLFFGRDQLIKSLVARLSATNVLLVLGASGSGKSSVIRAGLLPTLSELIGARFRYFTSVPDVNPFESLRSVLQAGGFSQAQTRELLDAQSDTPMRVLRELQRQQDQWLMFMDQFEEIFTVSDARLRTNFISALVNIAQDPAGSTKLVLAMRGDFFDRFGSFPEFAKLIEKNIVFVADMQVDELRLAIEQPAAQHGVVFEQGLVDEIIKDVQGQAGSLPLLEYTLNLLWQEEARANGLADRHLKKESYRQLGGVRGALQKRADEIYASFGDSTDLKNESWRQKIVRQIFLRVVDLASQGADERAWRPVRRRVPKELFRTQKEQEALQELIDQKLLVSSGGQGADATVEVAHEALFASWSKLKGWIEGAKQVIFARNRLADDARRWQGRQLQGEAGAEEELLSGSRLAQALEMRDRGDFDTILGGLSETEAKFLDASAAFRERRKQEEIRKATVLRRLVAGFATVALLAIVSLVIALYQRNKARETLSRSDFLQALASIEQGRSRDALAQLSRSLSWDKGNRAAACRITTLLTYRSYSLPLATLPHGDIIWFASFSPDGQRVVTASADETARVWNAQTGQPSTPPMKHEGSVMSAQFSPDGKRIVTGSMGAARVWDAQTGQPLTEPMKHEELVTSAQFSPDGKRIITIAATVSSGLFGIPEIIPDTIRIWDSENGRPLTEPFRPDAGFQTEVVNGNKVLLCSADGNLTAIGGDNAIRIFSTENNKPLTDPLRYEQFVDCAEFSLDGKKIVASDGKTARVWDAQSGRPLTEPIGTSVTAVAFSPDGKQIVTVEEDESDSSGQALRVWDSETGKPLTKPMKQHRDERVSAQFTPDSKEIVAVSDDNTIRILDASNWNPVVEPMKNEGVVTSLRLSPDGKRIVTASIGNNNARVWSVESGKALCEKLQEKDVNFAQFSPDSTRIVTASGKLENGSAQVWDAASSQAVGRSMQHNGAVNQAQFSPDGRRVVTASDDGTAQVWDAGTGRALTQPIKHSASVHSAQFSRDGVRVVTGSGHITFSGASGPGGFSISASRVVTPEDTTNGRTNTRSPTSRTVKATGYAQIWNAQSGSPITQPMAHDHAVEEVRFSPDDTKIVTTCEDFWTQVWDAYTGKPITKPLRDSDQASGWSGSPAQFSSDGKRLAAVAYTARVWDAQSGKPLTPSISEDVQYMQFNPDARWIVNASGMLTDGRARVWDARTGKPVSEVMEHGHPTSATSAEFSSDGRFIITAGGSSSPSGGLVRIWDAESGKPLSEPLLHPSTVKSARFSPDGKGL